MKINAPLLCVENNDENDCAKMADGDALKPAGSMGAPIFVSQNMFQHKIFLKYNISIQFDERKENLFLFMMALKQA